ncbi:MAG: hypothetical protein AAGG68_20695 [Bacteroidota bacterium]
MKNFRFYLFGFILFSCIPNIHSSNNELDIITISTMSTETIDEKKYEDICECGEEPEKERRSEEKSWF